MKTLGKSLAAFVAMLFAHICIAGGSATFSPTTLPDATVNASYSATVKVTVPSGAAILDIFCNSSLPNGLSLSSDSSKGEFSIYGTPKVVGSYNIDIGVLMLNNGSSSTASVVLPLTVKAGGAAAPSIKGASPASPVTMSAGEKKMFYVMLESSAEVMCMWSKLSKTEGWKTIDGGLYTTATLSYQYEHDGASTQLRAQVYSSDGKTLYGTASWIIASGGSGGGGDKVEFSVKNPPTGTVNLTLGQEQYFEVEASGDTKDCSMNWTLTKSASVYNLGSALGCSFKSSDYGAGTYQLKFGAEDKTGNKSEFFWTIVVSDSGSGGGGKVTFSVKNPPTGTVNLTLGQEQYFEVEADGDTKDYTLVWYLITKTSSNPIGSGLGCSFKSSDYGVGEYTVYFSAENKTSSDKPSFTWSVVVTSGAVEPTGEIKGASPDPYECSSPAYSKYTMIELADGAVQTFALTVDSNVEPYYYWTVNGAAAAGASTASSSYVYTHSASVNQKQIYCQVYSDSKMEKLLCYAVWVVKETAVPLEIVATPPVTDGMVEIPYGPIQFAEKNDLGITWDAVPALKLTREASTFASAAAETIAGGDGVNAITAPQMGTGYIVPLSFTYSMLGRTYKTGTSVNYVYPYAGYVSLASSPYSVSIYGLVNNNGWEFQNDGDGVYVYGASDHTTIRWKGQVVKYVMSGGGGGGGGGTGAEIYYYNAEMAVTLYDSGEVRVAFGECDAALELSGPRFYATGANAATLNLLYANPGSEMANGAQDVFFKSTLPPGLTFNATPSSAQYGQLYGTPTRAGTYTFTISGMNGTNPASTNITITIAENNVPKPAFKGFTPNDGNGNPLFVNVQVGSTANFWVDVENTTTIDWYVGGVKVHTGETFAFTPTQAQVNTYPLIVCKLSNAYYQDYATLSWNSHVAALPLAFDIADGATIPVNAKQFEAFNYKLGATGGSGASYAWGHAQYYRVSREDSTWADYNQEGAWSSFISGSAGAGGYTKNISPTTLSFCGGSYTIVNAETNGCIRFNGTSVANGLSNPNIKLLMPFGAKALARNGSNTMGYRDTIDYYAVRWLRTDKDDANMPLNFALVFKQDGSGEIRFVYGDGNVTSAGNLPYIGYCDGAGLATSAVALPGNQDPAGMNNAQDIVLTPQLPRGLTLAADGTISGIPTGGPGTYELKIRVTCGYQTETVTYNFVVEEGDNAAPELVSSSPEAENVVAYKGVPKTFSVVCTDADGEPLSYIWRTYLWTSATTLAETGSTLTYTPGTSIDRLLCYACDGVHEPTLVRCWFTTIKDDPLAFESSAIPSVETGHWVGGASTGAALSLNDHDTTITSVTLVSGSLPAGVNITHGNRQYVYVAGSPRVHGTYNFSVRVDLEDGDSATMPLTLSVTGADIASATWYVDPVNGKYNNSGLAIDDAFSSVHQIGGRLFPGDTVVFLPGNHPYAFAPVEGVGYVAYGGVVNFAAGSADTSVIDRQNGASIAFVVGGGDWFYDAEINIVAVPVGAKTSDYTVQTTTSDYSISAKYIEDGWLKVKSKWHYDSHGRMIVRFAENGAKECVLENFTIPHAAMFYNDGGENATVRFAGNNECSLTFCTFLWATNGVDLVLEENAQLWCHPEEKIEGFDTMTFNRSSTLKLDNQPGFITVQRGVKPIFAATKGAYTLKLANPMAWGARRAIIWDYEDEDIDELTLQVASGEDRDDYQFQKFGGHLFVVKREQNGGFQNLEELCPPAQITTQYPAASASSPTSPLGLTVGTPATFNVESIYPHVKGFTWMCGVRYELDGTRIAGDFYSGCTITPTDDMVAGGTHHLRAILHDYYHDNADTADWYFTVSPTPPTVAALPRISAEEGQAFERDFTEYVTGGYGALHFMRENGKLGDGLSLTTAGVLTGTMTAALDDEDLAISVRDEWGSVVTFTQKLHLKTSENEPPYLVSATPEEEELNYYIGDWIQFSAMLSSDDDFYHYHRWVLDDNEVQSGNSGYSKTYTAYYNFSDTDPAHETDVSTLRLEVRSESTDPWIVVKGWTITKLERPTSAVGGNLGAIPVGTKYSWTASQYIHLDCTTEYGEHIVSAEVIRGELPDGMEIADSMNGAYILGEARKLGTSMFSIQYTSSNGQKAAANYEITIVGEADTEPRTWTICSWKWWNAHNTEEGYSGTTYREQFDYDGGTDGLLGLAVGDTVNIYGDNTLDPFADEKNRLAKDGVAFNFVSGPIKLIRHPNQPLYLMRAAFSNDVTSLQFTLPIDGLPFGETYGEVVQVAEMPTAIYNTLHPTIESDYFFVGSPYFDDHRVLSVKILGHVGQNYYDNGVDVIYFADDPAKRDAVMENRGNSTKTLRIANAGVLPSSLTLKGYISYGYVNLSYNPSYPNHDTKIILDSDVILSTPGVDDDMPFYVSGLTEIRTNATINISQYLMNRVNAGYGANPVAIFSYNNGVVFTGDYTSEDAKVKVVLPCALNEHTRIGILQSYYDDRDPNEVLKAVLPPSVEKPGDYHFVVDEALRTVYLQNYTDDVSEEDHGETVWSESENLGEVALGDTLTHNFTNSTFKADGVYSTFTSIGQPFEASEGTSCTFDEKIGERELYLVPLVYVDSARPVNTVELGFAFPIEDSYNLVVRVWPNGRLDFLKDDSAANMRMELRVLYDTEKSVLSTLTDQYKHVYISRGEGTFTVRWGLFAMATLHQDGRIVVAYGPLADAGRKAGDATCPTICYIGDNNAHNVEFSYRSGLYAGKNDLVLTPTEYVSTATFSSATSGKLTHTATRPGTYKAKVLYHATDSSTGEELCTWTRDFTWTVTGEEPTLPKIVSFESSVEPTDDGIIHIYEGDSMPTFTATAETSSTILIDGAASGTGSSSANSVTTKTFTLGQPSSRRMAPSNYGLYAVVAKVKVGKIATYRYFLVVNNQTFHVDASTELASSKQYGTADAPWKDFPYGIGSGTEYWTEPKRPKFVFGDSIVVHPGTYHNPILLGDCVGSIIITNAPGGSAANTELVPAINPDSNYYTRFGWRAFEESTWSLVELTNGWQYARVPTQNAIVSGLAIRDSKIWGDMLKPVSLHGVAGGGAFGGTFVNCVFENCVATNSHSYVGLTAEDGYGGAAYGANLVNCLVVGCEADIGGAASDCQLYNCTVADNMAKVAAGGIDGECKAYNTILRYNTCNGEESDYASTYRPARLVPDVPGLTSCFTAGDPLFCDDYSLFAGSPCIGSGDTTKYPYPSVFGELSAVDILGRPRFTAGRISLGAFEGEGTSKVTLKVETVGVGTVEPGTLPVVVGSTQTFTAASDRGVAGWYTNGVLAASSGTSFTWEDIPAVCSLKVVFGARTLTVGEVPGHDYETIDEAIAAAGSGDTITVAAGTYGPIDLSGFAGALEIRAESFVDDPDTWGAVGDVIIDGGGTARCVTARIGDDSLVFSGLLLTNGYVNTTTAYNGAGGGGGIRGGKAVRCTIAGCRAYLCGGGAYNATLERCFVTGNSAFKNTNKEKSCGGGACGGTLYDCRVTGNSIDSWFLNGGGTYDAIVKNSFVWGNSAGSSMTSNAEDGEAGASLYVVEKVPTEQRVAEQPAQMKAPGWKGEYATWSEAAAALGTTGIDVADAIIAGGVNVQEYINRFEVTMSAKSGGYVAEVVLKEAEAVKIQNQIADAIVVDDSGHDVTVFNVQKMERTLTNTTPGFYYALEFASEIGAGSFHGERHLATGSGSLKLSATSQDTPSGFWRMAVYLTPEGN